MHGMHQVLTNCYDNISCNCICICNAHDFVDLIYRFKVGLDTLGVLGEMQRHAAVFEKVMCMTAEMLTARDIEHLFQPQLSEPGSSRRESESTVFAFWLDLLLDIEGNYCSYHIYITYVVGLLDWRWNIACIENLVHCTLHR